MRLTAFWLVGVSFFSLWLAGCSGRPAAPVDEAQSPKPPAAGPPPPPVLKAVESDTEPARPNRPAGGAGIAKQGAATERVQAKTGVGQKGRRLEDERLVQTIVTPAISLFRTQERMTFEVKIPHALQLYEAMNGKKPTTEKEFFEQIIKANQIQLPELPPGHRYVYDPETGQLLVERPAR
jgi:hypothetical protein